MLKVDQPVQLLKHLKLLNRVKDCFLFVVKCQKLNSYRTNYWFWAYLAVTAVGHLSSGNHFWTQNLQMPFIYKLCCPVMLWLWWLWWWHIYAAWFLLTFFCPHSLLSTLKCCKVSLGDNRTGQPSTINLKAENHVLKCN